MRLPEQLTTERNEETVLWRFTSGLWKLTRREAHVTLPGKASWLTAQ